MPLRSNKPARLLGGLFIAAGVLHFVMPSFYVRIMPPYLPWHRALVLISGAAEVLGGVGVLFKATRRWAGWGLIALLFAVYPANIHMTVEAVQARGWTAPYTLATLVRLPFQFVLIAWVWWTCLRKAQEGKKVGR